MKNILFPIACLNYNEWLLYHGRVLSDLDPSGDKSGGGIIPHIPPIIPGVNDPET